MRYLICLLAFCLSFSIHAQKTITGNSKLKEVTVFLKGAQLTRYASAEVPAGTHVVKLTGLSAYLDRKTIQVQGQGDFTILSIRHQLNFLNEKKQNEMVKGLQDTIDLFTKKMEDLGLEVSLNTDRENFLRSNMLIKGDNGLEPEKLKNIHAYYGDQLALLKTENQKKNRKIKEIQSELALLKAQLAQEQKKKQEAESELYIEVNNPKSQALQFAVSYLVVHALWYPTYDIRVKKITDPLSLVYKANISQNTGEDWKDVVLTISNANPYLSGDLPELKPWYLNFGSQVGYYKKSKSAEDFSLNSYISNSAAEVNGRVQNSYGHPLVGAVVRVEGTSIGAVTDADGNFSITIPEGNNVLKVSYIGHGEWSRTVNSGQFVNVSLAETAPNFSEVVISQQRDRKAQNAPAVNANQMYWSGGADAFKSAAAPVVHRLENQANLQITIDLPYTVESNGKLKTLEINKEQLNAYYEYRAVPKLEKSAYLVARIDDWARLNLLEGEANLYFENTFVGKTILDVRYLSDTLNISLGRDRNVLVSRMKVKSFSTREFIGSDRIEKRSIEIKIRNNKKEAIHMVVYDQIPVTNNKDISVYLKEKSDGVHDEKTGELKWMISVPPSGNKDMNFEYQVKFPKNRDIPLE